jgi:hypothetical protein
LFYFKQYLALRNNSKIVERKISSIGSGGGEITTSYEELKRFGENELRTDSGE